MFLSKVSSSWWESLSFIIWVFCLRSGLSLQTQEPRLQFYPRQVFHWKLRNQGCSFLGINRCGSFPLLSAPHSLFSIWTDIKTPEKIPGAPVWKWGEWLWLTGPSELHRNSPQGLGLNISSIRCFFTRSEIRKSQSPFLYRYNPISNGWVKGNLVTYFR